MSAAPSAIEHKIKAATAIVAGSVGFTSYSCDSIRRPNAQAHGKAIAIPAVIITSASRSTSQTVAREWTPEPAVYRFRACAALPRKTLRHTGRQARGAAPACRKLVESVANMRSVFNDRLTCSSSVRKLGDRQCRISVPKDRSNRLKGCLGGSLNPYVEVRASFLPSDDWKVGLLPLLANATIADVRHDADDFDIGLDIWPDP